jgi:uncharacterized protein YbjT (DUF2867 family)
MSGSPPHPKLLLVGGARGLVGRALLEEFRTDRAIVSVHPHAAPNEASAGVRWVPADVAAVTDWGPLLDGVEEVVNVAWYRAGGRRRFVPLADGLVRLVAAAERAYVLRFLHISVPDAPPELETGLPYLTEKRRVDRAVQESGLNWAIVRPTMLFGPNDRLLTVMMRLMHRYHRFPMFGDGAYHLSPIAASDLAKIVRRELASARRTVVRVGGPRRWGYRELTDRMYAALGRTPRYFELGPRTSVRLARLMESIGLSTIYAYEVVWLLSDMLGLPPYVGLDRPLLDVEPFLDAEAARLN